MNQIVKDKMAREIMVVQNDKIFSDIVRESKFYNNDESNFEEKFLNNYEYMVRGNAEVNFDYKQPIPYGIVLNENNEIFVYKRGGSGSNAGEHRLHSKIAIGVGGHIEREDENLTNPISDSLIREIEEELNIKEEDIKSVEAIGYINNESDEVSKVHIGVAYIVKIHNSNYELLDGELDNGEFVSIQNLEKMIESGDYDVEAWTKIVFEPVKKYLIK
ncbi:MAG: NUDIX domain-containing protein [Candidatus Gracilibacteria bacterium]|nr:NUDIX domain-containing protein [Candidatus Gracilibacteria bacterium]